MQCPLLADRNHGLHPSCSIGADAGVPAALTFDLLQSIIAVIHLVA